MKRYVFLGDLHGNLPATQAMDTYLRTLSADEIWFLGDAVGKGPSSAQTCDWVRANCDHWIGGNWDFGIGGRMFPADTYYWAQLGEERMRWLRGLPRETELWLSGIRFRVYHGRPVENLMVAETDKEKYQEALHRGGQRWGGLLFADSHRPFFRTLHGAYVINTGSVGNSMGVPRAHALLVEAEPSTAPAPFNTTILCVPYDNEAAAEAARREPDLPRREAYINEVLTGIYSR